MADPNVEKDAKEKTPSTDKQEEYAPWITSHPDGSITLQTITGLSAVQLEWKGVPFTFGIREADDVLRVVGFPSYEIVRGWNATLKVDDQFELIADFACEENEKPVRLFIHNRTQSKIVYFHVDWMDTEDGVDFPLAALIRGPFPASPKQTFVY